MTHIGYTGTRHPVTALQSRMIYQLLKWHRVLGFTDFHHGDCVNADACGAAAALSLGYIVHGHPPINTKLRAYTECHIIYPPLSYLARNNVIAEAATIGIGVPNQQQLCTSSGTWYTINQFRTMGKPHWIILPNDIYCAAPIQESGGWSPPSLATYTEERTR